MSWIQTVAEHEATAELKRFYEAAVARAGKVFGIVRAMSLNAPVLRASMGLYQAAVLGRSPLSRGTREMIAVVVSGTNGCHY